MTSRCRRSGWSRGTTRSRTSARPEMTFNGVPISWATSAASMPTAASFWACWTSCSSRRRSSAWRTSSSLAACRFVAIRLNSSASCPISSWRGSRIRCVEVSTAHRLGARDQGANGPGDAPAGQGHHRQDEEGQDHQPGENILPDCATKLPLHASQGLTDLNGTGPTPGPAEGLDVPEELARLRRPASPRPPPSFSARCGRFHLSSKRLKPEATFSATTWPSGS